MSQHVLDCRGLACPMPLLKAKLHWNSALAASQFVVLATDPGAKRDIPIWANRVGATITIEDLNECLKFTIYKPE